MNYTQYIKFCTEKVYNITLADLCAKLNRSHCEETASGIYLVWLAIVRTFM